MRTSPLKGVLALTGAASLLLVGCTGNSPQPSASGSTSAEPSGNAYTTTELTDGTTAFTVVQNPNGGAKLSFSKDGGFKLIEEEADGFKYAFKDMNGNGSLDAWEDWRKPYADRAADLAPQLKADQVSGLMLFSAHERAPGDGLSDAQKTYLTDSYLRNVLYAAGNDVEPVVVWTNQLQAYTETLGTADLPYVPVNFSSDPRHDAAASYSGAGGGTSQWPSFLGLAATFNPDTVLEFGKYASEEYRAMGLTNALSPQIDLASDPRWPRIAGTFGEDPEMAAKMAENYVKGFQTTYDDTADDKGWGQGSVSTVIKHFPGDGAAEGGRESHTESGKYAVMPGDNGAAHLSIFNAGMAAGAGGMMTSYSIITDGEGKPYYGVLMGSGYDQVRLDKARVDAKYDGVIVTDWGVTRALSDPDKPLYGMAWGAEALTVAERHFEILRVGHDQFGGNNDIVPIQEAYKMWDEKFKAGEVPVDAATRWAESGRRILTNLFSVGLYDNPYQDLEKSKSVVGNEAASTAGLAAQHNSVVVVKKGADLKCDAAPADYSSMKVYIPRSFDTGHNSLFGPAAYTEGMTINEDAAKAYFGEVVTDEAVTEKKDDVDIVKEYKAPDLSDVDMVIVGLDNPNSGGTFTNQGLTIKEDGSREWWPVSLQYRPYKADGKNVRKTSIAGDTLADGKKENRSYYGATSKISNESTLDAFERAVAAVKASGKDIPIISIARITNAMTIPAEFEKDSDSILVGFSVSDNTLLDVALGISPSAGRLPLGMPASMDAVEGSKEDLEKDVASYKDSAGNTYEYGFGLTCDGKPIS